MVEIEKNVPIPQRGIRTSYRYGELEKMAIGDSFVIRDGELKAWRNAVQAFNRTRNPSRREALRGELQFHIGKDTEGVYRCWRMADKYQPPVGRVIRNEDDDD